jgi:hypothetical protein
MKSHSSIAEPNKRYKLSPPRIEYRGRWYSAHWCRSYYGSALVPDDERLPISAIVWVEYAQDAEGTS